MPLGFLDTSLTSLRFYGILANDEHALNPTELFPEADPLLSFHSLIDFLQISGFYLRLFWISSSL